MRCIKLKILPQGYYDLPDDPKIKRDAFVTLRKMFRDAAYQASHVKNEMITELGLQVLRKKRILIAGARPPKTKIPNVYKKVLDRLENKIIEKGKPIISAVVASSAQQAVKTAFTGIAQKEVWNGTRSLPTYRIDSAIHLSFSGADQGHNRSSGAFWFVDDYGEYSLRIRMWSRKRNGYTGEQTLNFPIRFGNRDSSARVIFNKILRYEYTCGGGTIQIKRGEVYFNCAYKEVPKLDENKNQIPKKNNRIVVPGRVLGVDLGIKYIASMRLNDKPWIKDIIHDGISEAIKRHRARFERYRQHYGAAARKGGARSGHGKKNATRTLAELSHKERDFQQTINHQISKRIVDFAKKYGCEKIVLEDLSGVAERDDAPIPQKWLKRWAYYELQTYISYKAADADILVEKVSAKDTSRMCSKCGYIDIGNVSDDWVHFRCIECGHAELRTYNASANLANALNK